MPRHGAMLPSPDSVTPPPTTTAVKTSRDATTSLTTAGTARRRHTPPRCRQHARYRCHLLPPRQDDSSRLPDDCTRTPDHHCHIPPFANSPNHHRHIPPVANSPASPPSPNHRPHSYHRLTSPPSYHHLRYASSASTLVATLHFPTLVPPPSLRFIGFNTRRYASLREIALPSSATCCKAQQCNTSSNIQVAKLITQHKQHKDEKQRRKKGESQERCEVEKARCEVSLAMQLAAKVRWGQAKGSHPSLECDQGIGSLRGGQGPTPPPQTTLRKEQGIVKRWAWLEEVIGWKIGRRRDRPGVVGQRNESSGQHR